MFSALRYVLGIGITALIFFIKRRVSGKANIKIFIILAVVISSLLWFVPLENLFMTFDSPEDSYRYFNEPDSDIKWVVNGNDSDLVVGNIDGVSSHFIINRAENGWKVGLGINRMTVAQKMFDYGVVYVFRAHGSGDYYLTVINLSPGLLEVSDSVNSEFLAFEDYDSRDGKIYATYYAVLTDKDEQYRLYINGNEISIF